MNQKGIVARQVDQRGHTTRHLKTTTILMVCFAFAACYFRFFVFLHVPLLPSGDAPGFVSDGARIVAGQLPYRDFFEMLPPGMPLTYALLVKTFGLYNWIPPLTMACLAAVTAFLMTLISARLMQGFLVFLPALLFTGFILLGSADATHHWFSTILILMAVLALLDEATTIRIIVAGICCGTAACFTQSKGFTALLAFMTYLIWQAWHENARAGEYWRRCLILCAAALTVFVAVNWYFVASAGLSRWFYCLVTYPLRYYPAPAINNWRVIFYDFQNHKSTSSWIAFPFVYCTVPASYIAFLVFMRRRRRQLSTRTRDRLMLLALIGVAMFLAIASAPSLKRLSSVSPPAMILLAWFFDAPGRIATVLRATLGTLAAALAIAMAVRVQAGSVSCLDLPAGRTAFTDPSALEEYTWVRAHTHPGQFFWGMPPFYVPFHLKNPATIAGYDASEYTRPEDVSALIQALQQHQVTMMIMVSGVKYQLTVKRPSNHLGPLVAYLHGNYRLTKTFVNGDEVWERADTVPETSESGNLGTATSGRLADQ
jgi:hypothetical protein